MITKQLSILIQLATIDGRIAAKERKLIEHIAKVNNVDDELVKQYINKPQPMPELTYLTDDERFEYLYMVIQVMKVDGLVFKSEIDFCEQVAEKLGYKRKVVAELSKNIYSDPSITADRDMLKKTALKFKV